MVLGLFLVRSASSAQTPRVDLEHLAVAGDTECDGYALQTVADVEGHPEGVGTRELGEGSQGGHRGDEEGHLEEEAQLESAFPSHLLACALVHLHADDEAGHRGAASQEHCIC